jgi:NADH-quinone oxidoreductase subunit M
MNDWLTTILIVLPMVGALVVWLLPLPKQMAASLATLVALVEVGVWVVVLERFDFSSGGLQFEQQHSWFSEINSSYHVGLFAFSVWFVGLTAVCGAAACMYAWWMGRERPRAYFGLLLFLIGSVAGVFASQDLLLFYAFFEAMLIPLYVMIGVWGGAGRLRATITFIVYTVAGSLLMLAAIIIYGLQQNSFDLLQMKASTNDWLFLGFAIAFAVKAPFWPFHGWLPDAYRESPPEISGMLSGLISKVAVFGFLRIVLVKFPGPTHDFRVPLLVLCSIGLVYGSLLAFRAPDIRGVIAYSSLAQMGLIGFGLFAANDLGLDGTVLQVVNHGLLSMTMFLLAGMVERRTSTGELSRLGGMARGRPALATILMTVGVMTLAVPLSSNFAGEFLILAGVFEQGWGWAVVGAVAIVLAAMYALRLISAVLHRDVGSAVDDAALDLRGGELAVVVPLVLILLVLSAWPNAVSGHSFKTQPVPISSVEP